MKEKETLSSIEKIVFKLCNVSQYVAGSLLVFLVLVLVADAAGRFILMPVTGSYEMVQYGFALIVAFSVAYTQFKGGHVRIELIFASLPAGVRRFFTFLNQILSLIIFSLVSWRLFADAIEAYKLGEESSTLTLPVWLFMVVLALGFTLLVLVTVVKLIYGEDKICHS
jgi:TRAP-type mannitol/chloroaromatic compound transport system permease small subunit